MKCSDFLSSPRIKTFQCLYPPESRERRRSWRISCAFHAQKAPKSAKKASRKRSTVLTIPYGERRPAAPAGWTRASSRRPVSMRRQTLVTSAFRKTESVISLRSLDLPIRSPAMNVAKLHPFAKPRRAKSQALGVDPRRSACAQSVSTVAPPLIRPPLDRPRPFP
jgi:hypothetical protein